MKYKCCLANFSNPFKIKDIGSQAISRNMDGTCGGPGPVAP
jgi:hypothetical protein